ncbi:MAG: UDP-N-acetylglucosamine 2-epimerase [Gemmatimonadales bacterium]
MRRRKVCVVVTARPSYSRILTALQAIARHPDLELQIVVAASALLERYGTVVRVMEEDGLDIAARVFMVIEGENPASMAKTTGLGLIELATTFDNLRPDVVVTVGDRYETLATATAAAYMNLPLTHVQGGEVTGSIDEKVRHATTKLADLHLVATERARERVIRLGEDPGAVHVTGCPSIDLAAEVLAEGANRFDPFERYGGLGATLDLSKGYLVVLQHPVTNEHEEARRHVTETLYAVKNVGLPAIWFWPNVDAGSDGTSKGIRVFREQERPSQFHYFRNMIPRDFLRLLVNCSAIVGNSSVAIREGSYLGVPAVSIGSRQNGRERGPNVIDVGYERGAIEAGIRQHLASARPARSELYGDGRAGGKIAERLARAELRTAKVLAY